MVDELLAAFRRNDPAFTYYTGTRHENGIGRRLGEALQGNQHVSHIELPLSNLFASTGVANDDDDDDDDDDEDDDEDEVEDDDEANNDTVVLKLRYIREGEAKRDEDEEEANSDAAELLLRYIREGEAMREIELSIGRYTDRPEVIATLAPLFLRAIAENPCIEEVRLYITVPPEEIVQLMQTTQSLKTLHIDLDDVGGAESRERVAKAIGANRTLEYLVLWYGTNTDAVEAVLRHLGSQHSCLLDLNLTGRLSGITQINALAYFLRSTALLERLELSRFSFDKEHMEYLVEGLHANQSIMELSMEHCEFDLEATALFRSFVQSVETRSQICFLSFSQTENMFKDSSFGATLVSMLSIAENADAGSCIASSLEDLNLQDDCDFIGFCNALQANASRIRLSCLRVQCCDGDDDELEALCNCLPKLVYLKKLDILEVHGHGLVSRNFVDALRQNGSLQCVTIADEYSVNDREAEFREINERGERLLIEHYCRRNEAIQSMVALYNIDKAEFSLLPMVFQAAKQAPRTAPNAMLIGLLAAGDSIGIRQCERKRVRPDE